MRVRTVGYTPPAGSRLGDGCHHVFLDVGANVGVQTRKLFEPDLYRRNGACKREVECNAVGDYRRVFGSSTATLRTVCAVGFGE